MKLRLACVLFVAGSVWPLLPLHAQWGHASDVQTPVSDLVGVAVFDSRVIPDGSGGMFITWQDRRNSDTLSDIYAQRLGSNGRQQWTEDGIEVCRFDFV